MPAPIATRDEIESPYAWWRLVVSLLLMTIGGSGMYSITVVLPRIQADFTDRKFNRMRPSMARVLGLETRSAKEG